MPAGADLEEPVVVLVGPAPVMSFADDPEAPPDDIPDPEVAEPEAPAPPEPEAPDLLAPLDDEPEPMPDDPDPDVPPIPDVPQAPSTKTHARGMINFFI
jgi:hypothetical protein